MEYLGGHQRRISTSLDPSSGSVDNFSTARYFNSVFCKILTFAIFLIKFKKLWNMAFFRKVLDILCMQHVVDRFMYIRHIDWWKSSKSLKIIQGFCTLYFSISLVHIFLYYFLFLSLTVIIYKSLYMLLYSSILFCFSVQF